MALEEVSRNASFGGVQSVWSHQSQATGTTMRFGVYLPPAVSEGPVPAVLFLSGLTCTEQNVVTKGMAQVAASELGLAVIAPDTSPRGEDVPDDEAYDFGQGAGFYLNATQAPWATHFQMERYVVDELLGLLPGLAIDTDRLGVTGHSMGGHGALCLALKYPSRFRSVSAFAPIASATRVPWGEKALGGYLGEDRSTWAEHDASLLLRARGWKADILVDQGSADGFLESQLQPHWLREAADAVGVPLELRLQQGYDHSYFFVSTFMADHLNWHAQRL